MSATINVHGTALAQHKRIMTIKKKKVIKQSDGSYSNDVNFLTSVSKSIFICQRHRTLNRKHCDRRMKYNCHEDRYQTHQYYLQI